MIGVNWFTLTNLDVIGALAVLPAAGECRAKVGQQPTLP
jgi:hypothetical protein